MNHHIAGVPQLHWHYTTEFHLRSIRADGIINLTSKATGSAVWFSLNALWERTVVKVRGLDEFGRWRLLDDPQATFAMLGWARIGVAAETAPYTWDDFRKRSGLSRKELNHLRQVAYQLRARPSEWRLAFEPVPERKWLAVEVHDGKQWTAADLAAPRNFDNVRRLKATGPLLNSRFRLEDD
jgi:hypothetical protein